MMWIMALLVLGLVSIPILLAAVVLWQGQRAREREEGGDGTEAEQVRRL